MFELKYIKMRIENRWRKGVEFKAKRSWRYGTQNDGTEAWKRTMNNEEKYMAWRMIEEKWRQKIGFKDWENIQNWTKKWMEKNKNILSEWESSCNCSDVTNSVKKYPLSRKPI